MRLAELVGASEQVRRASGRLEKVERLAACLRRAGPAEIGVAVAYLAGTLPQGRIGVGQAALRDARSDAPAPEASLSLTDVDAVLARVAEASGRGAGSERARRLGELFARATPPERDFLARLLAGELRQGALAGVVVEAVARAAGVPAAAVRRALMLEGDLPRVAGAALAEGEAGLARFDVTLFRPLVPMLASPARDVPDALARLERAAFEWKVDGARVQVHKAGRDVRVYTRRLHDVTERVPELVEAVGALPARELILDGESLAVRPDGRPHRFQTTLRRLGRRLDVDALRRELPLRTWFFDCLRAGGETLIDRPAEERAAALATRARPDLVIPRLVTADAAQAERFLAEALARGHEGLMAKSLSAPYAAGARGAQWLKLKPAPTLDLVVLAAEWGSGRRQGWLSNLHLGARDPTTGGFVMLGKTFKGLTDEMLAGQTGRLLALETHREARTVYVRPELVVEIAYGDLQRSTRYPGGLALRFARVRRYRDDKGPADADTIDRVRGLFAGEPG